jgi:superfamily II DNA helicase RecQ
MIALIVTSKIFRDTEEVARRLQEDHNVRAAFYHAECADRKQVQEDWQRYLVKP